MLGGAGLVLAAFGVRLCPFAFVFGIPCPGCGLARATLELCRGHVHEALAAHPLVLVATPAMIVGMLHATRRAPAPVAHERIAVVGAAVVLVALVAVWLARFAGAFGGPATI